MDEISRFNAPCLEGGAKVDCAAARLQRKELQKRNGNTLAGHCKALAFGREDVFYPVPKAKSPAHGGAVLESYY